MASCPDANQQTEARRCWSLSVRLHLHCQRIAGPCVGLTFPVLFLRDPSPCLPLNTRFFLTSAYRPYIQAMFQLVLYLNILQIIHSSNCSIASLLRLRLDHIQQKTLTHAYSEPEHGNIEDRQRKKHQSPQRVNDIIIYPATTS